MCLISLILVSTWLSIASSALLSAGNKPDLQPFPENLPLPHLDSKFEKWDEQSNASHHRSQRPLIRTNGNSMLDDSYTSRTLFASLLVFNVLAITMISFLFFQRENSSAAKAMKAMNLKHSSTSLPEPTIGPGQLKMLACPDGIGPDPNELSNVARCLEWRLKQEVPLHAHKATSQHAILETDLLGFIAAHFEKDKDSSSELSAVLANRRDGVVSDDTWLSWSHRCPLSIPVGELMEHLRCDGLLDWSRVPASALADGYMQLIVTSGVGSNAMLHEGEDTDWFRSLHIDLYNDWSVRGFRHLFVTRVDTLLVGCIGRKKVVMLPPHAVTPGLIDCTHANSWCCSSTGIQNIRDESRERGWIALEKHAAEVGGVVFTICPDTFCYIPAGWWHIVRPLDDFTAVLSPSFIQGCWSQIAFDDHTSG